MFLVQIGGMTWSYTRSQRHIAGRSEPRMYDPTIRLIQFIYEPSNIIDILYEPSNIINKLHLI